MANQTATLQARIETAVEMLHAGLDTNNFDQVDTAFEACSQLLHEAIDAGQFQKLELIVRSQKELFSKHDLLPRVVKSKVSEDILQLVLEHTTITPTHLVWNAKIDEMSSRMTLLIVNNLTDFGSAKIDDLRQIAIQTMTSKHESAFQALFYSNAVLALSLPDAQYRQHAESANNMLDGLSRYIRDSSEKAQVLYKTILQNKDLFLSMIKRNKQIFGEECDTVPLETVSALHAMGFTELVGSVMPGLVLRREQDPRQYQLVEAMGGSIGKDCVIAHVLHNALDAPDRKIEAKELSYMLESEKFDQSDLESIRNSLTSGSNKVAGLEVINKSLARASTTAITALFKERKVRKDPEFIKKLDYLVGWSLEDSKHRGFDEMCKALVNLRRFPQDLVNKHAALRDCKFGRDVGL